MMAALAAEGSRVWRCKTRATPRGPHQARHSGEGGVREAGWAGHAAHAGRCRDQHCHQPRRPCPRRALRRPLPVDAFVERIDDLSIVFLAAGYLLASGAPPEVFLDRCLYVHKVLTCRSGSALMLSLIYSEMLKTLRLYGSLDFNVEVFFPHDLNSLPRGYDKHKSKLCDEPHIMTSKSLLVEVSNFGMRLELDSCLAVSICKFYQCCFLALMIIPSNNTHGQAYTKFLVLFHSCVYKSFVQKINKAVL